MRTKELVRLGALAAALAFIVALFGRSGGVLAYVLLWAGLSAAVLFLRQLASFFKLIEAGGSARWLKRVLAIFAAVFIILIIFESYLQLGAWAPVLFGGSDTRTMPEEWERREADVPGANAAYYWHGKLHVFDEFRMRRSGPFPKKRPDAFRIMVVGDSLTYGYGVDKKDAYPAVIERELKKTHRVEVLNLGICGYQTENLLWVIKNFTTALDPDLIVYGACLNDFLPSRVGQYDSNNAWPFPLPESFKKFMAKNTRSGEVFDRAYNQALLKLGIRRDFIDDILIDFNNYQEKFKHDVEAMNDFARSRGLPPVLVMVVHQQPEMGGKTERMAKVAESYLVEAGMTVIPSRGYFEEHDGEHWVISKWESHPNEHAHRVFAGQFVGRIREIPELAPYRIERAGE